MTFKVEIECDNEAFEGMGRTRETSRILKEAAEKLAGWGTLDFKLRDINGNTVGRAWFED